MTLFEIISLIEISEIKLGKTRIQHVLNNLNTWLNCCDFALLNTGQGKLENIYDRANVWLGKDENGVPSLADGHVFTEEEILERNRYLNCRCLLWRYGTLPLENIFLDNEYFVNCFNNLLVFNVRNEIDFKHKITKLSELMNLDCCYYQPKNSESGMIIGTNGSENPGYMKEVINQSFVFKDIQDISTVKVGNCNDIISEEKKTQIVAGTHMSGLEKEYNIKF